MPSPVGHSLIGLAVAGALVLRPGSLASLGEQVVAQRNRILLAVGFANAPDIDYVPGVLVGELNAYHHLLTHSVGWVALLVLGAWLLWRALSPAVGWREAALMAVASASHLVADVFTDDGRAPFGILALWPFHDGFIISPVSLFYRLQKHDWGEILQPSNFAAVGWEVLVCLPLLLIVLAAFWRPQKS